MASIRFKRGTRAQLEAAATANGLAVGEPYLITDEERFALGVAANAYVVGPRMAELELQRVHDIGEVGAKLVVDVSQGPVQQAVLTQTCDVSLPTVEPGVARLVRLYLVGDFAITVNEQVPFFSGTVTADSTLTGLYADFSGFGPSELYGKYVLITSGAAAGASRMILSNGELALSVLFEFPAAPKAGDTFEIFDESPAPPFAWLHGEAPALDSPKKLLVFSGTSAGWVGDGGVYG
ncbi:MAG TPA: hypothetical protein PLN31_09615 [Azoarcus taiwanensis]|nr:hypothetical protein [Azoarcus taiwanensis]